MPRHIIYLLFLMKYYRLGLTKPPCGLSDGFQQEQAELDTGLDCCPVPDGQEPEQDRTSSPVAGLSVPVSGTGLSIQAWTDGTRGWWHILPSLEIQKRAQSLDDPDLTGLLSYRYQKQQDAMSAGRQVWTLLTEQAEPVAEQELAEPVQACVPVPDHIRPRGIRGRSDRQAQAEPVLVLGLDDDVAEQTRQDILDRQADHQTRQATDQQAADGQSLSGILKLLSEIPDNDVAGLTDQIAGGHPDEIRQALTTAQAIVQAIRTSRPELDRPVPGTRADQVAPDTDHYQNIQTDTGRQACSVQQSDISEQAEQDRNIMKPDSRNPDNRPVVACSDGFQQEQTELDTGQDCCPVPDGQEPGQGRPVDARWSVPVPRTGLSIQAWTAGTRGGWWQIVLTDEIEQQAKDLYKPKLDGLLKSRHKNKKQAMSDGRKAWKYLKDHPDYRTQVWQEKVACRLVWISAGIWTIIVLSVITGLIVAIFS